MMLNVGSAIEKRKSKFAKFTLNPNQCLMFPVLGYQSGDRLLDIPCGVCGDRSSGKHYGIFSCDGKLPVSNIFGYKV